jgi:hypothetical protein
MSSRGGRLGIGEEGRGMLLHQAVQRGLLGVVAFVVILGAIQRPVGLPVEGSHENLPRL